MEDALESSGGGFLSPWARVALCGDRELARLHAVKLFTPLRRIFAVPYTQQKHGETYLKGAFFARLWKLPLRVSTVLRHSHTSTPSEHRD